MFCFTFTGEKNVIPEVDFKHVEEAFDFPFLTAPNNFRWETIGFILVSGAPLGVTQSQKGMVSI